MNQNQDKTILAMKKLLKPLLKLDFEYYFLMFFFIYSLFLILLYFRLECNSYLILIKY